MWEPEDICMFEECLRTQVVNIRLATCASVRLDAEDTYALQRPGGAFPNHPPAIFSFLLLNSPRPR